MNQTFWRKYLTKYQVLSMPTKDIKETFKKLTTQQKNHEIDLSKKRTFKTP